MRNSLLYLQYQYSKLFTRGFNRKKFECISTTEKLYAMNTSKNTFIALIFTLFSCGLLFTGIIEYTTNHRTLTTAFVLIFFIIHPLIGVLGLRQFLWLVNGRQELRIEHGKLTLSKKGTFLTKSHVYELALITTVKQAIDEDDLSLFEKIRYNIALNRRVIFGHVLGQVLFSYNGQTVKLFSDLDKAEKIKLITAIEDKRRLN